MAAVTETRAYFDWMSQPAAISGRQPAVSQEEFPEWQRLQQAAAEEGQRGFTVGEWRTRQDRGGCVGTNLPAILCKDQPPIQNPSPETGPEPPPTEAATSATTSTERDTQRRANLEEVSVALGKYHDKHGSYPSTSGNVQSLCAYPEDAGCALGKFLKTLPSDSLGDNFGYWYASDGSAYTLYTALESPPPDGLCPDKPEHLAEVQYLWCIAGR